MTSPSSSSTSLSTPCVLGCCGPMFTVIVSVLISAIRYTKLTKPTKGASMTAVSMGTFDPIALDVRSELFLTDFQRLVRLRGLSDLHRIVLARWMSFPVLRHQQPP